MGKSVEYIAEYLKINGSDAQRIRDLIDGSIDPDQYLFGHLERSETLPNYQKILTALNEVLSGNGVESIGENNLNEPLFSYVNLYDTFAPTIAVFNPCPFCRIFVFSTLGDILDFAKKKGYILDNAL